MSKSYWRSAIFRNWLVALLILAALVGAPLVADRLPSELLMGLPSTLVFFAIGMPFIFLVLAVFKISMQQALDRNYELDSEDQLQRRRVPKRLKSFPVKALDVPDTDAPISGGAQTDGEPQQQRKITGMDQTTPTQVTG